MSDACFYCGRAVYPVNSHQVKANRCCQKTRDHYFPQLHGSRPNNVVVACWGCNNLKGEYPPDVFEYYIRHKKEKSPERMKKEFSILCFELARFGLIAAIARINWQNKNAASTGAGVSRRRASAIEPTAETAPQPAVRDQRGRFTKRDLRRKA
jgi:hypothetical protein